jgi:hypothetical protein
VYVPPLRGFVSDITAEPTARKAFSNQLSGMCPLYAGWVCNKQDGTWYAADRRARLIPLRTTVLRVLLADEADAMYAAMTVKMESELPSPRLTNASMSIRAQSPIPLYNDAGDLHKDLGFRADDASVDCRIKFSTGLKVLLQRQVGQPCSRVP